MNNSAQHVTHQALDLSVADRIALAEQLLMSLDRPDAELDALWAVESEKRLDAYEAGAITTSSLERVFSKYKTS
jgi:putative addiction module component (TIGR02574 family)